MDGAKVFEETEVNETGAREAHAGNGVKIAQKRDAVYCPNCGGDRTYRIERRGLLRRSVFPIFGLYPWVCKGCGREALLRKRNRRRRRTPAA
jgi:predicted RNA-binding Zn-ribbon protein involved in translation (DUF1610 family)